MSIRVDQINFKKGKENDSDFSFSDTNRLH